MRILAVILIALLFSGCSVQVSGMQSPVAHDYGTVDWVPLNAVLDQTFITGPGYSAALQNDPATTPATFIERLEALPEDAREGRFDRLRVGLRLAGREDTGMETGARIQLAYSNSLDGRAGDVLEPIVDFAVDDLPRSGDRVVISDLPDIESGSVMVIRLIPGDGPDRDRLQVGLTSHRAPYGGWRAASDGNFQGGAIVFDTRYERDVAVGEVLREGVQRARDGGTAFLALYSLAVGGLLVGAVVLWRGPGVRGRHGR